MQSLCFGKYCKVFTILMLKWFKVSLQKSYFFLCSLFMSLSYMVPQHVAYISFLIRDSIGKCCTRKEYFKCCRPQNVYQCINKITAHIKLYLIWIIHGYKTICQHNVISYEIYNKSCILCVKSFSALLKSPGNVHVFIINIVSTNQNKICLYRWSHLFH